MLLEFIVERITGDENAALQIIKETPDEIHLVYELDRRLLQIPDFGAIKLLNKMYNDCTIRNELKGLGISKRPI